MNVKIFIKEADIDEFNNFFTSAIPYEHNLEWSYSMSFIESLVVELSVDYDGFRRLIDMEMDENTKNKKLKTKE